MWPALIALSILLSPSYTASLVFSSRLTSSYLQLFISIITTFSPLLSPLPPSWQSSFPPFFTIYTNHSPSFFTQSVLPSDAVPLNRGGTFQTLFLTYIFTKEMVSTVKTPPFFSVPPFRHPLSFSPSL